MSQTVLIFSLFAVFQFKHFLCDFPLQFEFMVFKKCNPGWNFFFPLLGHASIHGLFTTIIVLLINPSFWWLGICDLVIHFVVDRLKSGPRYLGRYNDVTKSSFWNILGFDQALHHLTHVGIIYLIAL